MPHPSSTDNRAPSPSGDQNPLASLPRNASGMIIENVEFVQQDPASQQRHRRARTSTSAENRHQQSLPQQQPRRTSPTGSGGGMDERVIQQQLSTSPSQQQQYYNYYYPYGYYPPPPQSTAAPTATSGLMSSQTAYASQPYGAVPQTSQQQAYTPPQQQAYPSYPGQAAASAATAAQQQQAYYQQQYYYQQYAYAMQQQQQQSNQQHGAAPPQSVPEAQSGALSSEDIERTFDSVLAGQTSRRSQYQQYVEHDDEEDDEQHPLLLSSSGEEAPIAGPTSSRQDYGSTTTSATRSPPTAPPQLRKPLHRRAISDTVGASSRSREGGWVQRPPSGGGTGSRLKTDPLSRRKRFAGATGTADSSGTNSPLLPPMLRQRSYSGDSGGGGRRRSWSLGPSASRFPPPKKGHHRRTSSLADSVATDASMMSVVSDIRKSSFFGGYNQETGDAQLHFPLSTTHLVMADDKSVMVGKVYQVPNASNRQFEDYHRAADDLGDENWNDDGLLDGPDGNYPVCSCDCANCHLCHNKQGAAGLLPTNYYVIGVQSDLYKRVVDEICVSAEMPCGLFFCGHHEDVNRPSIAIAWAIVILLFTLMGAAAYMMRV